MTIYTFKPDKYSSHMKIISSLEQLLLLSKSRPFRILDVGCSKGFIGKSISKKEVELYGIEYDKEDIKIAKKWYTGITAADLDGKLPPYNRGFFDAIIFADVLEHLKHPEQTLSHFTPFLKKYGTIILSTANVANLHVRLQLLLGNFDYTERGILDKTHLRLFTRKTFYSLACNAGLTIVKEEFTPIPLPLVNPLFSEGKLLHLLHKANNLVSGTLPNLLSYQILLYCKKK